MAKTQPDTTNSESSSRSQQAEPQDLQTAEAASESTEESTDETFALGGDDSNDEEEQMTEEQDSEPEVGKDVPWPIDDPATLEAARNRESTERTSYDDIVVGQVAKQMCKLNLVENQHGNSVIGINLSGRILDSREMTFLEAHEAEKKFIAKFKRREARGVTTLTQFMADYVEEKKDS